MLRRVRFVQKGERYMAFELTGGDKLAVSRSDSAYFNDKGASCYLKEDYERAVEYYRLAAVLGSEQSLSNLGYCYMYGRGIPRNNSLAVAYFQLAADQGNVDAIYKLGDIYRRGACGVEKDPETASYYFHWAGDIVGDSVSQLRRYPSLCKALALEKMPGGYLPTDPEGAYAYLKLAKEGYEREIDAGARFYEDSLNEVQDLLNDPFFYKLRGIEVDEEADRDCSLEELLDLDDDILPGTNYGLQYDDEDEDADDAEDIDDDISDIGDIDDIDDDDGPGPF